MKKTLKLLLIMAVVFGLIIILISSGAFPPESGESKIVVSAEAVDNGGVRLLITYTYWGMVVVPNLPETVKIFATVENGEFVPVEISWPNPHLIVSGDTGEGEYTYGEDPHGKEIEVRLYTDNEVLWESWRITIS